MNQRRRLATRNESITTYDVLRHSVQGETRLPPRYLYRCSLLPSGQRWRPDPLRNESLTTERYDGAA